MALRFSEVMKTKVAYIVTPIDFGGAEKVSLTFLRKVNQALFDIHVFALSRPWETENVFIDALKKAGYDINTIPVAKRPRSAGRDYIRVARCIYILYGLLSRHKFDLIHTHGYFANFIGAAISYGLNIPHVATCHGFISNDRNLKYYNILDKLLLRVCDKVIVVSEEIKNDLVKCGINGEKIVIIRNAVENALSASELQCLREEKRKQLSIRETEFVVGYAGRLSKEKGLPHLIKAASLLRKDNIEMKILIIGDGPERNHLETLAFMEGISENTIFTGFINDVEKWLPTMDIFILPSLTEGTPMALLEAMSTGLPVIASRVGGVPMVVDENITGFLVEPGDSSAIAEKVKYIKENKEIRNKMSIEVSKAVKIRFDVLDWCRRIEKEYADILKTKCNS